MVCHERTLEVKQGHLTYESFLVIRERWNTFLISELFRYTDGKLSREVSFKNSGVCGR